MFVTISPIVPSPRSISFVVLLTSEPSKETTLPLAKSTVRETDTLVEAKSGDVIVIGGLMSHKKVNKQSKVPLLGDIPYLGELFTNKLVSDEKVELVILLKPTIVGTDTWKEELDKSLKLLEKWYPNEEDNQDSKAKNDNNK